MKTFYFLPLLFLLAFTSCNKDDDSGVGITAGNIVGVWNLTSVTCNDGKTQTEFLGQVISSATYEVTGKDFNATVELSENPNNYLSQGTYTSVSKITVNGQTQTQELPFEPFQQTGTWKLENNSLIISSPGVGDATFEVTKLTATNLEYKVIISEVVEESGVKSSTSGTYFFKLSR